MSPTALKSVGIGCLVVSAVLTFVAIERYRDNANKVEAAKNLMQSMPLGGMMKDMQPSAPTATKYALLFAAIAAVGGVACLASAPKPRKRRPMHGPPQV